MRRLLLISTALIALSTAAPAADLHIFSIGAPDPQAFGAGTVNGYS
jgi:hypothetical protein